MVNSPSTVLYKKIAEEKYPEARVIVLDDSFNTFQHVANCLLKIIPESIYIQKIYLYFDYSLKIY